MKKEKDDKIINGYKMIYKPDHPEAVKSGGMIGYVYEHRAIGEQLIGRSLRDNEVVHHLDEVKINNLPSNLLVLENSQHRKLHAYLNKYFLIPKPNTLLEKSGILKTCSICSVEISNDKTYCSMNCSRIGSRIIPEITAEELKEKVWSKPTTHVARELGVSDTAVAKLCKKLNVEKPNRGYWAKVLFNKI